MPELAAFGRRKFMTMSALADVLQDIKEHGMPSATSRSSIKRARDEQFASDEQTIYDSILKKIEIGISEEDGSITECWIIEPRACMYYMLRSSPKLEAFLHSRLALHPNDIKHPWTIILYNDEITPGNALKHHNQRKVQAYYWSFREFGMEALTSEWFWFTLIIVRSDTINGLNGLGPGQLCKHMILAFSDMSTEGFQFGSIILWAKVQKFVSDEAACKACFDVKGASGVLCCLKCRNVISKASFGKMKHDSGMVPISELDIKKFKRHSDNSIIANANFLHSNRHLTAAQFKKLQIALGLVYSPNGVLLCTGFNPESSVCFDYQHVYFVKGIFNIESGLLLDLLKNKTIGGMKMTHTVINDFFKTFTWPSLNNKGKQICEKRSSDGGALACSASEGLGSFALLQMFLCLQIFPHADDEVKRACVSFYALCMVITALTMTPRGNVSPTKLLDLIVEHLKLFKAAYGEEHFVPKFHFSLHLPEQLARWLMLVACFTHERKHKEAKRYLEQRHNPKVGFEKSVMQDVLYIQMLEFKDDSTYPSGVCLLRERKATSLLAKNVQAACQSDAEVFTASWGKASCFTTCHVDDVVYVKWSETVTVVGQISFLSRISDSCLACVRVWMKMPQLNMYGCSGDSYLLPLSDIIDTCIYRKQGDIAFVVPPRGIMA
jgi:hypothetical protein